MSETVLKVIVTHKKPLPLGAQEVLAQRFYMWAYSQDCEVGVKVEEVAPKCGSECDVLCQQPDGHGWCGKQC